MSARTIFYVYAGPGMAVLNAIDCLENYLKKLQIPVKAEELKADRRTILEYLQKNERILFILVKTKKPENGRFVMSGNYFKAYLTTGIAPKGGYEGQRVAQLYLIPAK